MKQHGYIVVILLSFSLFVLSGFSSKKTVDLSQYKISKTAYTYYVPQEFEVTLDVRSSNAPVFSMFLGKTYIGFKEALGFKESQGDYSTINRFGYLGKYQFAATTLSLIGINNPDRFMKDSKLQEKAFTAHTSRNKWILRKDIKRFSGRYIAGVKVTESGILAAAHLAGAGNVKKYLRSGGAFHFEDAFGTSIRYYLKKFSGYDTSHIKPDRTATVI